MLNDHTLGRFAPFGDHLVRPIYADYAFANIADTVELLLTGERRGPVLPADCFGGAYPRPKRVVTILIDAFGFEFWQRYADRSQVMSRVCASGVLTPVSALFPSTTSASISTLNLGVTPAVHGLYEWNMYVPAYGETIQTLPFATLGAKPEPCQAKGYDVGALLTVHETVHTRLRAKGVRSRQLAHASYAHSAYNSIIGVGADVQPHLSLAEALGHLRTAIETPPRTSELIGFYWAGLDATAHLHGPDSPAFEAETLAFWQALDATLVGTRSPDTLFLITADHGHIGGRRDDTIYVNQRWPQLADCLAISPTGHTIWPNGSPRDMFLHVKPERRAEVIETLARGLADIATVMPLDSALDEGLFGAQDVHPELRRRLGDVLVLPYRPHFVWWFEPGLMANPFNGHHGGLSRAEMTTVAAVADGF